MTDEEEKEEIRQLAKDVLPAAKVDGDSYGAPTIRDIVEMLVEHIQRLTAELQK